MSAGCDCKEQRALDLHEVLAPLASSMAEMDAGTFVFETEDGHEQVACTWEPYSGDGSSRLKDLPRLSIRLATKDKDGVVTSKVFATSTTCPKIMNVVLMVGCQMLVEEEMKEECCSNPPSST